MSAPSPSELADLQRWFCDAVQATHASPAGVEAIIRPSDRQTSTERLAVYRRSYLLRLLECMRARYPALRHALGRELFDEFACDYLRVNPSRSYTLSALDRHFPEHLSATRPDLPPGRGEPWPDFIVDLARLERLVMRVFEGSGLEDRPGWEPVLLPQEPDERWAGTVIEPAPPVHLLKSSYPVGRYLLAVYRRQDPPLPLPEPTFLALGRCDYEVQLHELTEAGCLVLESLIDGATLGAAVQRAALPMDGAVWGWFRAWAETGLFAGVSVPGQRAPESTEVR